MAHPQFQVKSGKDGLFHFNLTAQNRKIILSSEKYKSKQGCLFGIESVRKNAHLSNQYIARVEKFGQYYFVLTAPNGEVIGKSDLYSSVPELEKGIELVKKNVPIAEIEYYIPEENN